MSPQMSVVCPDCSMKFRWKGNLKRHRQIKHHVEKSPQIKVACDTDGCDFTASRTALRRHKADAHNIGRRGVKTVACPVCEESFFYREELAKHANDLHPHDNENFVVRRANFEDETQFKRWFDLVHMQSAGTLRIETKRQNYRYYRCSRVCNRKRRSSGGKRIRATPSSTHCTSFVTAATLEDGQVSVKYVTGHLGHETSVAFLKLSSHDRQRILRLIQEKLSVRWICDHLRQNSTEEERLHYVTHSDIRSIAYRYDALPGTKDKDDMKSVQLRLCERMGTSYHKYIPATDETGANFILVIQSEQQKEWVQRYGRRGFALDDTFNVTRYELKLTTLMLVDDCGRGKPGAFMVSHAVTTEDLVHLFAVVQERSPNTTPDVVMTDDTDTFWNAYTAVYDSRSTSKLLCRWHFLKAWKKQSTALCSSKEVAKKVFDQLRALAVTSNYEHFQTKYSRLQRSLREGGEQNMLDYISRYYGSRVEQWAAYCRTASSFSTNMIIERWHRTIKYSHLDRSKNRRLDITLEALEDAVERLHRDHEIADIRGLREGLHRKGESHRSHRRALKSYEHLNEAITEAEDGSITIQSATTPLTYYDVDIMGICDCHPTHNMHCVACGCCSESFTCSCPRAIKAGVPCKHLHAVSMWLRSSGGVMSDPIELHSGDDVDSELSDVSSESDSEGPSILGDASEEPMPGTSQLEDLEVEEAAFCKIDSIMDELVERLGSTQISKVALSEKYARRVNEHSLVTLRARREGSGRPQLITPQRLRRRTELRKRAINEDQRVDDNAASSSSDVDIC